ncbi:MAG: hypothetical protein ACXWDO_00735 [Bacteroidia bacterium]
MKKVFALVVLAGSLSLFACESNTTNVDENGTTDSTVNVNTDVNIDSTTITVDTAKGNAGGTMGTDSVKTETEVAH